ncbi:RING finger membrane protein [Paraphoma chrysanthemicola]|nr:RING finger membrane protein [Paraphoma chrysanthemicola]
MATDATSPPLRLPGEAHDTGTDTDTDASDDFSHESPAASDKQLDKDEADTCRICRGEGSPDEPLFYPCKCSGSIKYVHQECLMEWLSHTQKKHCELCKTSFRFTKLYHPGMPNRIPTAVFIRRAAMHVVNMFLTWCRGVLVACVWLLLLPWCMRVVWRSLFWVGDGGWSQNVFLDAAETADAPRLPPFNMSALTLDAAATVGTEHNHTLWSPLMSVLFPSDNNASVSEPAAWTFAKRLLFGFPLPLASYSLPALNHTSPNATYDPLGVRSPSLLSDVPFFNWFHSKPVNRFVIDVLEGQIITLLVVVAFILIFLIREWVVQQQPVINMVALGDNAVAHRAENHEQQDQEEAAAENHVEEIHEPEPQPMDDTDDNPPFVERNTDATTMASAESQTPSQLEGPVFPTRSSSLPRIAEPPLEFIDPDSQGSSQRPHMPARDQSFIATGIRRSLEERNDWSFETLPQSSQDAIPTSDTVPDSWDDADNLDGRDTVDAGGPSDQEQDSEHSSESWQQVPDVVAEYDSDQVLEGERPLDKGKSKIDDSPRVDPQQERNSSNDSENLPTEENNTHSDTSSIHSDRGSTSSLPPSELGDVSASSGDSVATTASAQPRASPGEDAAPPQAPEDPLNQIMDWLFGDIAPAIPTTEEQAVDEHIVRNFADEAPFVPFVGNEPQEPIRAAGQDPEVAAAAAQAGIDVNDQEAIEDAEDLEGILELIGMQGPIVGLFQNVLFSAVLISTTLACAVWLPYLWGKVVILVMGSPVSLLIKLPLQIIATLTDLIVDFALIVVAGVTYWSSQIVSSLIRICSSNDTVITADGRLASISATTRALAEGAMDRIAKLFIESPVAPRPDYFRLSVNSHAALRSLQNSTSLALNETSSIANAFIERASADSPFKLLWRTFIGVPRVVQFGVRWLSQQCNAFLSWAWSSKSYKITFDLDLGHNTTAAYTTMDRWTASDRMIAIFAGYAFFAFAGAIYLKRGTPFSTSQQGRKVERIILDILTQAGGVLKVILIISIEMLAFPLYCGLLLDLAMLPLFKNATLYTRWQFACGSPWTSGFVHWFIGTCYMFHFALFVSMCRKIMRKGVLYFIRDPDDPTFHPVRDVLERSVTTQLRKIAFSALVYGALVIVCLGGVVWSLSRLTSGVLPIHWTTEAPSLEFPLDLLFYNFLTPVIIKFYKPSETIHSIYKWCFKKCAGFLQLSSFLFGEKIREQAETAGKYVRAPASDQVRVPKGQSVFIEVDKDNKRKDGNDEGGVHNSDLVTMVFIPNWFRLRIFAFVVTIWIFMGLSGVGVTILPLLFGRFLFSLVLPDTVEMNDIHAFSLGVYTLGSIAYSAYHAYNLVASLNRPVPSPLATLNRVATTTSRVGLRILRFTYVWASLVFAIPFLFAVLIELYFLMPLHAYLGPAEPHVVHLIQDWTLGFLYSRLAARLIFANRQSRPARAFNAVVRDGYLYPNARIATRCFLIPVLAVWLVAIAIPSSLAFTTSRTLYAGATEHTRNMVWRFSFPVVGLSLIVMWASKEAVRMLNRWRLIVRDEVYLIGERLHNFGEKRAPVQSRATEEAITAASQAAGPEGSEMR